MMNELPPQNLIDKATSYDRYNSLDVERLQELLKRYNRTAKKVRSCTKILLFNDLSWEKHEKVCSDSAKYLKQLSALKRQMHEVIDSGLLGWEKVIGEGNE